MPGKHYSQATIRKARDMYIRGSSHAEIAAELGLKAFTSSGWATKDNWPKARLRYKVKLEADEQDMRPSPVRTGIPVNPVRTIENNTGLFKAVATLRDDHLSMAADLDAILPNLTYVEQFQEIMGRSEDLIKKNNQLLTENSNLREQMNRLVAQQAQGAMVTHSEGTRR